MVPVEGPYAGRDYAELRLTQLLPRDIAETLLAAAETARQREETSPVPRL
jgi:hypothetical protein